MVDVEAQAEFEAAQRYEAGMGCERNLWHSAPIISPQRKVTLRPNCALHDFMPLVRVANDQRRQLQSGFNKQPLRAMKLLKYVLAHSTSTAEVV